MSPKEGTVHKTITVPKSLAEEMDKFTEINWSGTAVRAFRKQIEAQKVLSQFEEPGITEEEIGRRIRNLERALARSRRKRTAKGSPSRLVNH
jgi:hypothetical protein